MTTRQLERAEEQGDRDRQNALIREWVLSTLGKPPGLRQVEVRLLWGNHYRVNVLAGEDAMSVRIVDSFFLVADSEGDFFSSTPTIARRY